MTSTPLGDTARVAAPTSGDELRRIERGPRPSCALVSSDAVVQALRNGEV